jgi:phage-related protein
MGGGLSFLLPLSEPTALLLTFPVIVLNVPDEPEPCNTLCTSANDVRIKRQLDYVHIFVYFGDMKKISFYLTGTGKCPVQEHLDTLSDKQVTKIAWVLKIIRDIHPISSKYFKKLVNTDSIWEVRVDVGRNTFRLLGFFSGHELIVLTNSFQKKSQKTPSKEIKLAERRKREHLRRS